MTDRLEELTSWHADWSGLRVAVLGLGVTGFAAADTLIELGAEVLVVADRADPQRANLLDVLGGSLVAGGDADGQVRAVAGFAPDVLVVSPGYHPDSPLLRAAAEAGTPVWGDIDLAWRVRDKTGTPAEWIAVTGTNGKTTTVRLVTAMLQEAGTRAIACGNIGVPVLDAVRDPAGFDVLVVELSSYQLHWTELVSPWASVCLNVADDHLDWHGSAEAYAAAKGRVYERTQVACVYNLDDPTTERLVRDADVREGARAIGFGLSIPGPSDLGIVEGILCDRAFLEDRQRTALELTTVQELHDAGLSAPHVVSNVLAASALARSLDVTPDVIRRTLQTFRLDPHRIELVAEQDGVRWVDDSKATNPHAADASLGAFDSVVWVVGGLLKGVDIGDLVRSRAGRIRAAVVLGTDRSAVLDAFARHAPAIPVHQVTAGETGQVMPEVVRLAAAAAQPGDVVLLAPAAASMDQFDDYGHRGREFQSAVLQLLGGVTDDPDAPAPA
ncbi:MAG: UDP-N-acetylmuramoyl-L-alanyl-D-glutamate synthetase [Naasia sp.]|jgi:UDP-N-acetylmuramoylalanine--D-glutamate ligase|uniref:UDP-N-acetylmuramoyl-L-alanine--D-glutamate ligase n=1 Tax=Naasia sp. TaxID=2546198 RepID=UPI00262E4529|nr:UDP-N-acetylmuramoyl-L-alanine--D-glutamate ligase [Naasia sp.]MCU1569282.1 UDP-N-acetylmuramoyl-L-alanyl-D-glutamate synthetase [Naasia sp.]